MKITLPQITNGQDLSTLNSNFQAIASQLNNNVLYRVNIGSEPNTPAQDLDFNGKKIYNLSVVLVNGVSVLTLTQTAEDATGTATAAALSAQASATAAASSAASANAIVIGALQKSNNLSDLTSISTAKTNLGLNNVTNTSDANKPISTAQQTALDLKAPINGATFTGTITMPVGSLLTSSPTAGDSSNKIPTTFYVQNALNSSQPASFTKLFSSSNAKLNAGNVAGQPIVSGSNVTITNWLIGYDVTSSFNATTGVFVVPDSGFYLINAQMFFTAAATAAIGNVFTIIVNRNGTVLQFADDISASTTARNYNPQVNFVAQLTAGDLITVQVFQNSGSTSALSSAGGVNFLQITRIP